VPGAWGPFEVAVQAVVAHHPATTRTDEVLGRIVDAAGLPVEGFDYGLTAAFPGADAVAAADLYGVPDEVARTLRTLATEVAAGNISLECYVPFEDLIDSLTAIDGIAEEAAQWIALRLGARDAFPRTSKASDGWRPWRALAAMHLEAAKA
jgi:AraC family transcriptional regulator of adaptative response / DNA-3-methyladenine glycosylase II